MEDLSMIPLMLDINRWNFQMKIALADIEFFYSSSIEVEIQILLDFASSKTNLHLKSIWFDWKSIEDFLVSLQLIRTSGKGVAQLKDISIDKFSIKFSRTETETSFTFIYKWETYSYNTFVTIDIEADTINIVHRQLANYVRNINAIRQ